MMMAFKRQTTATLPVIDLAKRVSLLLILMMAYSVGLWAQSTTADILGSITDPTGATVSGATVKATSLATGEVRTLTTDEHGDYIFNALQPAHYKIEVTAPGFKTFKVQDLLAAAGDRARVDVPLAPGSVTQTVEVESSAPLLQTDSSTVATTVVEKSVQDLPLNGRNFVQLAQLTVGANEGAPGGLTSGNRPDDRRMSASISVNGQSDVINNEMIDGADNNERIIGTIGIRPSIDAISEFRVQTNDYTAEAGRTAGGVINIITKSGGNKLHGTLYEYFRNDALDASTYDFGANLPKSELRQNQYGGSIGGPIRRDKTFFFADYEGLRLVQGISRGAVTVPTLFEEQNPGNFTDVVPNLNVSQMLNPVALNWFKLYPAPNTGGAGATVNNYTGTQNKTQNSQLFDIRLDHQFTPNDMAYARFSYNGVSTFTPGRLPVTTVAGLTISPGGNIQDFAGPANDVAQNAQVNYTHIFSPTLLANVLGSWLRIDNMSKPLNYGTNATTAFGLNGVNLGPSTSALTPMMINNYANVGDGIYLPLNDADDTYQIAGTVTWTHGIQNIKAGMSLIRRQAINNQDSFGDGIGVDIDYIGGQFLPGPGTQQNFMADFLMDGGFVYGERSNQIVVPHYRTWESGYFVQDDVRMTRRLTLNIGLRYDIMTPYTEINNGISNFNPAGDAGAGSIDVASSSDRTAGVATHYTNLAPRFGFADDMGHGLVLRGGFGLSFFPSNYTSLASLKNQPFVSNYAGPVFLSGPNAGMPLPTAQGTTSTPADPLTVSNNVSPNFDISYLEQFNLMAQKQLGQNVVTIGYVGMLGRHLGEALNDLNAKNLETGTNPFPNWSTIAQLATEGTSFYHAMQATFERRYAHGLAIDLNYTWAHGEDNITGFDATGGDGTGASPTTRHSYEWGNSDLDLHHRVAGNLIYELPFGKNLTGARGLLAKGWQVNLLTAWETGLPVTVINALNVSGTMHSPQQQDRPNMTGPAKLNHPSKTEWFDTSKLVQQAAGTLGNERRNQIYGPHYGHLDTSLFKNFPISEGGAFVQFRAESFNLSNTPTFGNPNATMGASLGTISSLNANYSPRVFQMALKLQF